MAETSDDQDRDEPRWREPLAVFGLTVAILSGVSLLSTLWAPLADHILAVAAVVFIAVPFIVLRRRGADFSRYGIDLETIPLRDVLLGGATVAVVFPLYAVGHHVWETSFQQRQFEPSFDNYRQWSVELDAPPLVSRHDAGLQVRTVDNDLLVQWDHRDDSARGLIAEADRPFVITRAPGFTAGPAPTHWIDNPGDIDPDRIKFDETASPSSSWYAEPNVAGGSGQLVVSRLDQPEGAQLPRRLTLHVVEPAQETPPDLYVGAEQRPSDEPVELKRTHWWLLIWGLTHLVLVALPEEYFYRGYLQTRLGDLLDGTDAEDAPTTFLGFSRANWATSGLFAIGHVLIPVGGTFSVGRAAVFFPSLLFGWLRDKTGAIIAPTILHAGANMMVLVAAVHYF